MRTRRGALAAALACALACVSTRPVEGARDSISTWSIDCTEPYALTQDCSAWSGAARKAKIDGFDVKLAGTADGRVILVMDAHLWATSFSDPWLLNSPAHSRASNDSYEAVRKALERSGIEVLRVRPLESLKNIDGYVLELGADGYALLKTYWVD